MSPLSAHTQSLLAAPRVAPRRIVRAPIRVLEAPRLQDDYYLNLLDWGQGNMLAVGLGNAVYLWNAVSSQVSRLCDVGADDTITSVAWHARGSHLAVGLNSGEVPVVILILVVVFLFCFFVF